MYDSESDWCCIGGDDGLGEVAIYVYGDIPPNAEAFFAELRDIPAPEVIDLYVNSMGGDLYSAMAIHDRLKSFAESGCVVRGHVVGVAASGAALILAAAGQVHVCEDAFLLLHEPRYVDAREADARLEDLTKGMARRLAEKSGRGKDAVMDLLSAGKWMTASEAVSTGLVDGVEDVN